MEEFELGDLESKAMWMVGKGGVKVEPLRESGDLRELKEGE